MIKSLSKPTEGKGIKEIRYKCRKCRDWFKREPFGYKGYSATCNKCFDELIKNPTTHRELLNNNKLTSATILRKNPDYYAKELEINAKRSRERNYYKLNPNRIVQIKKTRKLYQNNTGVFRKPRRWTDDEVNFLIDNYESKQVFEMAKKLNRSWISVEHKMNRLELTNYKKYVKKCECKYLTFGVKCLKCGKPR